jgi:protein-tyrosine phosphatase
VALLTILSVCSGNICRSPLAEGLLKSQLSAEFSISSAGVIGATGDPVTEQTASLGKRLGVDLSSHRSRYLNEAMIEQADLILTASRSHRRAVVELVPRRVHVTFTLREFARLASQIPEEAVVATVRDNADPRERLLSSIALVTEQRGQTSLVGSTADDDIVDPYRRNESIYQQSADEIVPAVSAVSRILMIAQQTTT